MTEHTILVAVTVEHTDREAAEAQLRGALSHLVPSGAATSWWVAEDDRRDGSDCDSAVFVTPGFQHAASVLLNERSLTSACNVVERVSTSPHFSVR